ncbi:hypothetical protein RRG08_057203 [Elysia crispata]|uniref:Uncharacterized protein n=1 Tax=Elysia crispata TaxID=231223 RepID=A0AAE0XWW9_9GAST|nr:hypothetical protein RRG08_057203 [Elysia crispata]
MGSASQTKSTLGVTSCVLPKLMAAIVGVALFLDYVGVGVSASTSWEHLSSLENVGNEFELSWKVLGDAASRNGKAELHSYVSSFLQLHMCLSAGRNIIKHEELIGLKASSP